MDTFQEMGLDRGSSWSRESGVADLSGLTPEGTVMIAVETPL
jgi:hypothetical protein